MRDRLVGVDYVRKGVYGLVANENDISYWRDFTYRIERAREELEMIFKN